MLQTGHSTADHRTIADHSANRFGRAARFIRERGPGEVFRLVRQHGAAETSRFVIRNLRHSVAHWHARRFDRRYGVDTAGSIQLDELDVTGPNRSLGNECVCTSPKSFRWIMGRVAIAPQSTFIDIGAGKSRTLLLASTHPFRRAIGVEFARELVEVSRRNIDRFRAGGRSVGAMEIVHADAGTYVFPDEPLVVYLYNPFSRGLLEQVVGNLAESLRSSPRPCVIIYTTGKSTLPWALRCIGEAGPFTLVESGKTPFFADAVRTMDYAIFSSNPGADSRRTGQPPSA